MTCPNCRHRAGLDDLFCERCGAALRPPQTTTPVGTAPANASASIAGWHPVSEQESRNWAVGAHVSALIGGFLGGVPAFLGPLIVWLLRRRVDAYAAAHARAAFNFHLSVVIYVGLLVLFTFLTFGLGVLFTVPALIALGLAWLVFTVLGIVRAADDRLYRYPLSIPFLH